MSDYSSFGTSFSEYFRFGSGISVGQWLFFLLTIAGVTLLVILAIDWFQSRMARYEEANKPFSVHEFHCRLLYEMGFDEQEALQVLAALRQQSVRRLLELFEIRDENLWMFRVEDAFDENEENALRDLKSKLNSSHELSRGVFGELYPELLPLHQELLILKDSHHLQPQRARVSEYANLNGLLLEEECLRTQIGEYYCFRLYQRETFD